MPETPRALRQRKALHDALKSAGVAHALIGGWAAIAWGTIRATKDIDFIAVFNRAPLEKFKGLAEELGYSIEWRAPGVDDPVAGVLKLTSDGKKNLPEVDIIKAANAFDRAVIARA